MKLKEDGDVSLSALFYNPNIHPQDEFDKRKAGAITVAGLYNTPITIYNDCEQNRWEKFEEARNASERNASERNASERNASEHNASERNASERNASERNASERNASERNASEPDASQLNSSQPNASEPNASEHSLSEQSASGFDKPANEARQSNKLTYYRRETTNDSRCRMCYCLRLGFAARYAKEKGFDAFTTSLLISPYQDHELITELAGNFASEFGVEFYYEDFRSHFREGQRMAREMNIYRQKYCGCILSSRNC